MPEWLYSVSDIQNYFENIIKKHNNFVDYLPKKIYVNKKQKGTTFRIKTGYYVELLRPETMKLLGSTKSKINEDENVGNVPHLEFTEAVLGHCNIANQDYQHNLRAF